MWPSALACRLIPKQPRVSLPMEMEQYMCCGDESMFSYRLVGGLLGWWQQLALTGAEVDRRQVMFWHPHSCHSLHSGSLSPLQGFVAISPSHKALGPLRPP